MAEDSAGEIRLDLVVNRNGFEKQIADIQGLAKKAGVALAAAFSVKQIWDFGAACIELGSDLAEVQNVVDVSFPQMSAQVDKFAKDAAASFGLSETMAKRFTGTFGAMAKAFGFNEQAAYEMSTTLTGLAGDVASFYNTSQDEAFTKLKSVFTGETETLKDLGVVMTQAALDQYALANGYGKTTQAMSEAEKVALRYQFVQDQLSLASGDFLRTSDSWANQVRVLKLQFESLQATIGQGLINVLTPVIQVINTIIGKLMSLANAFKAFTDMVTGKKSGGGASAAAAGMEAVADSADQAGDAMGGAGGAAKKAAKDMKGVTTGIDELNIISQGSGSGGSGGGAGGGYAADEFDMGTLDPTPADAIDERLQAILDKLKVLQGFLKQGFWRSFWDTSVLDSIQGSLENIGKSLADIFTDPEVLTAADNYIKSLAYNLGRAAGGIASVGASIADNLLGGFSRYLESDSGRIKDYIVSMFQIGDRMADIAGDWWEALATVFEAFRSDEAQQITADIIGIFFEAFMGITELYGEYSADLMELFTAPFVENKELIKQTLEDTFRAVEPVFSGIKETVEHTFDSLRATYDNSVGPMFDSFKQGLTELYTLWLECYNTYILPVIEYAAERFNVFREESLNPLIDKFIEFGGKAAETITDLWENVIQPFIAWFIVNVSPIIAQHLQTAVDCFFYFLDGATEVLSSVISALEGLLTFLTGVFTGDWKKAWNGIKQFLSSIWTAMKSLVNLAFTAIYNFIQSTLNQIQSTWTLIWNGIQNFTQLCWETIRAKATEIFTAIMDKLSEIWTNIQSKATEIFSAIRDKLAEIWDEVKKTVEEKWNAIKEWFGEIWTKIKDVFKPEEMISVGKSIMNKLWEGMKDIWSDIAGWLGDIADFVGGVWDSIVDGATRLWKDARDEAEEEEEDDGDDGDSVSGHASGGFPKSGQMFVARENGIPEMVGSWGGRAAVANNAQITEGIARAVRSSMSAAMTPVAAAIGQITAGATPHLAMVGSTGSSFSDEERLKALVNQASTMSSSGGHSEEYLAMMVDLLTRIVDLIENMDLTVNIDIREIRKKLVDLEKRTGYTLKTT